MPKKCKDEEIDVAVLQEQMNETKSFIKDMQVKHLPHIYTSLESINIKMSKLNIWDKLKSISLIIASGMIGTMATYIFLK
mgnify:CR=1 FL=1